MTVPTTNIAIGTLAIVAKRTRTTVYVLNADAKLNWDFVQDLKWLEMDSAIPSLTLKNACMMVENAIFKITVEVLLSVDINKNLKINLGVYNKMMSQDSFISIRSCNLTSFHD